MSAYTIGIDVGAKGAMCILKDKKIHKLIKFKSIKEYSNEFKILYNHNIVVYVEKIHSMPRQGVRSMFTFGQRFGEIIGMLEALEIAYNLVTPQEWQKKLAKDNNLVYNREDTKESIGSFIYDIFKDQVNLNRRTGRINTDLTDAIAISYTYAQSKERLN